MGTDADELMNRDQAADEGPVLDHDVSGHVRGVRDDDVVPELAVVRDVRVGHQQAVRAHHGPPGRRRSPVHGREFAYHRPVADLEDGFLALVLEVLGIRPEHGSVGNPAAGAERRVPLDQDPRTHP